MTISVTTITYGAVFLSSELSWPDRATSRTPGSDRAGIGRLISQRQIGMTHGTTVTISAIANGNKAEGHFTKTQRDMFVVLEGSGEVVTLNYHGELIEVIVPIGGVDLFLFKGFVDVETDNWYTGNISFLTV